MGFSSEEFIKMREMESFRFDYYEPVMCDKHYWFDIEAESKEEAIEKAKELVEKGNLEGVKNQMEEEYGHEGESILYFGNEVVENYLI